MKKTGVGMSLQQGKKEWQVQKEESQERGHQAKDCVHILLGEEGPCSLRLCIFRSIVV